MSELYSVAIYLRLSKEDEDMQDESNSIANQRLLLKGYVEENFGQCEWKEFVDDGFSGTNLRRPGIADLLERGKDGRVNCVIVKDFSRFSRDYIELGSYLEQIFPFLGVRFISVNDKYDSAGRLGNTMELDTSFKGLLYDLYSKDLSVKVKSSLHSRKEKGQYAIGNVPFGYAKARDDRHRLVIAEDEAGIVRKIFALALEGKTSPQIAKQLNQEKVPTPISFKIKKKQTSRTPVGNSFHWSSSTVWSILKNPSYAGDMVYGKYDKDAVGGKNHIKPRSEWKAYRDHHEAIIPRDIFDKVQEQKPIKSRKARSKEPGNPLQGKVVCGGCRGAMRLREGLNPYFSCGKRYVYASAKKCVPCMNLMFLEQAVLFQIDSELSRQEKLEQMRLKKASEIHVSIEQLERDRERLLRKKAVLQRERLAEYEKSVFDPGYQFQKEDAAIEQADMEIQQMEAEINRRKEQLPKENGQFIQMFANGCHTALTKELVDLLIQKIIVYDEQHIEIKWKFEEENAIVSHMES